MRPRHRKLGLGIWFLALFGLMNLSVWGVMPQKPTAPPQDTPATKPALQKLGEFIGEWKTNGKAKAAGKDSTWSETLQVGWKFKDGASWIQLESKEAKSFRSAVLSYDSAKKLYRLALRGTDGPEQLFEGNLSRGNLVLTRKDPSTMDVSRMTLFTLADGARMVLKLELQAKGKGLFTEQYQLAGTKEGESFAGGGKKKPECVVTGGAGTIPVSYQGKTYYVCCSGCKDEFEANPKKYAK